MQKEKKLSNRNILILSSYIKLMRAAESITIRGHRHLSQVKLSFSQFAVLEVLNHHGPLCQRDIAGKILKSQRNITMVIDNLEKRKLVRRERNAEDRRYIIVHLTEKGRILFKQVLPQHIESMVEEMGILSETELEELSRLCRILGKRER
ncbi:MarR family winged helix-turn-helix transcriptional regulator [Thermodesulfobacteriota bacterium]